MSEDNDFADVTLACEDDQQVEAPKVILAEQVLFNRLFHSHHHININVNVVKQARGQASLAKDSTNLIPIRLLSCWN